MNTPTDPAIDTARHAVKTGRAAQNRGDTAEALRWFGRARRLAPNDPVALHLLISAIARVDAPRALSLSAELVAAAPSDREALIGRVALLHRCGHHTEAADALDALLRRFAAPRTTAFATLAGQVARQVHAAGWVGVTGAGAVLCHAPDTSFTLDGARLNPDAGELKLPATGARRLLAESPRGHVLGGTIDLVALRRVEGFVTYGEQGLNGWALCPADPDAVPVIEVFAGRARSPLATLLADDATRPHPGAPPHARGFHLPAAALPRAGVLHARARGGAALAGSPLWIGKRDAAPAAPASATARARGKRRPVDVIMTVAGETGGLAESVASVRACLTPGARVVVVDDARLDAAGAAWARRAARAGELVLLRHKTPRGAAAAVNTGLRHAGARDVLVLQCGARLPPDGIARLQEAARAVPCTGTVTPMTLRGGITALSAAGGASDPEGLAAADEKLRRANHGQRVELPVCGTACTYIMYECLRDAPFPETPDAWHDFARGAAARGWRHIAACDIAVATAPEANMNKSPPERLHPGLTDFTAQDPLHPARHAYEAQLWAKSRAKAAIILVTHAAGGGVERHIADRVASIRDAGMRAIVVRPRDGYALSDGAGDTHPNLTFPTVEKLAAFLRADHPGAVELHHTAAHLPGIERLAGLLRVPFDIVLHDYSAICPRVTLSTSSGAYCGEPPDARDCDDCIADRGARIPFTGRVADLRAAQETLFAVARAVIAPSHDAARRLRRYMPRIQPLVRPWQDDAPSIAKLAPQEGALHVAICGAISAHKGYNVLLACARDASRRDLKLQFTVVGHTVDDARLLATGRVFITGPYAEGEAAELLRETAAHIGFIPSVWPETWCYGLSHLWQAGLHVLAFDLGAQAERIIARGAGTLVPLGLGAPQLNDTLMGLPQKLRGGEGVAASQTRAAR